MIDENGLQGDHRAEEGGTAFGTQCPGEEIDGQGMESKEIYYKKIARALERFFYSETGCSEEKPSFSLSLFTCFSVAVYSCCSTSRSASSQELVYCNCTSALRSIPNACV